MKAAVFLAAILFSSATLAAPILVDCSGGDWRMTEGKTLAHTIQVMFDPESRTVEVRDRLLSNLTPEHVEITEMQVTASNPGANPRFNLVVNRNDASFVYERYENNIRISNMGGICKVVPGTRVPATLQRF